MAADASAYAALGLEPGADASDVDRAYKQLIKEHHPDREGGDSARAAEINRAYRELRAAFGSRDALDFNDPPLEEDRAGWVQGAIALLLALAVLFTLTGPASTYMRQLLEPRTPALQDRAAAPVRRGVDAMDQPLHLAAVTGAVREAVALLEKRDDGALLDASRGCHRALHLEPSITQLDRCAAFDDAVLQLQDHDPMWDQGPFSQIAVTGRQWSGSSALSNDYLAIDSRLDRIRVQVELALAPPAPPRIVRATGQVSVEPTQ
jgi:hypothetical protein